MCYLGVDRQILCTHKRSNPEVAEVYHKKKSRDTWSPNRHLSLQSPFRSAHNDLNIPATTGSCPESPFVPASSAPTVIQPGYPLQCQTLAPSTSFSSLGRERSHRGLNLGIERVGDDSYVFGGQKLLHSQSDVSWRIVMTDHPTVYAHSVRPLLTHVIPLHLNISQYNFTLTVW